MKKLILSLVIISLIGCQGNATGPDPFPGPGSEISVTTSLKCSKEQVVDTTWLAFDYEQVGFSNGMISVTCRVRRPYYGWSYSRIIPSGQSANCDVYWDIDSGDPGMAYWRFTSTGVIYNDTDSGVDGSTITFSAGDCE